MPPPGCILLSPARQTGTVLLPAPLPLIWRLKQTLRWNSARRGRENPEFPTKEASAEGPNGSLSPAGSRWWGLLERGLGSRKEMRAHPAGRPQQQPLAGTAPPLGPTVQAFPRKPSRTPHRRCTGQARLQASRTAIFPNLGRAAAAGGKAQAGQISTRAGFVCQAPSRVPP